MSSVKVKVGVSSGLMSASLRPIAELVTACDSEEKVLEDDVSQNAVYRLLFYKFVMKPSFVDR